MNSSSTNFRLRKASVLIVSFLISHITFSQVRHVVDGSNQFAFEFFNQANEKGKNVCVSPFSLYTVAAILQEGARDTTAMQMREVFHFEADNAKLHTAFSRLLSDMDAPGSSDGLVINNGLWLQDQFHVLDTFKNVVASQYNSEVQLLNFMKDEEGARKAINDWSEKKTGGLITEILPPGSIKSITRLVVTNAIYFSNKWLKPFDTAETTDGKFFIAGNESVQTKFMNKKSTEFEYYADEAASILKLDYADMKYSMVIILPRNSVDDLELNNESFQEWMIRLKFVTMDQVSVPKFGFEQNIPAKRMLVDMGLTIPFRNDADFSGITGEKDLILSDVFHKTYIKVDESGTTAAAVTAATAVIRSAKLQPVKFVADKPFVFVLVDSDTDAILFVGKVGNPTK